MSRRVWPELRAALPAAFLRARTYPRFDPAVDAVLRAALEPAVARRVGFAVELMYLRPGLYAPGAGNEFQIMPTCEAEQARGVFWGWHLDRNRQFFPHPLDAATAFVAAWEAWVTETW